MVTELRVIQYSWLNKLDSITQMIPELGSLQSCYHYLLFIIIIIIVVAVVDIDINIINIRNERTAEVRSCNYL